MRLRSHVMPRRTGETQNCTLYFPEKHVRGKLGVFEELAWKRKIGTVESLSRREPGVILGRGPES